MSEAPSTDPQNCGGMLPMRTPCPFCGGVEFRIEAGGQTWRGVKGYSDPQYWHLYHNGTIPEGDGFQMCSVQIRARTEAELYSIWDWRADTVSAQIKAAVLAEREACAIVVEELWAFRTCQEVSDAIRSRKAKEQAQ